MKIHHLPNGRIHEGDWLQADLAPGYSLAIVDGPYGMSKAAWDRVKVDDLAAWYTPHIERLSGLMAASATVYLWNTAAGWARLDPVMRAAGWGFETLIVWDKVRIGLTLPRSSWPAPAEVCGHYVRGDVPLNHPEFSSRRNPGEHIRATRNVWTMAEAAYRDERLMKQGLVLNMNGTMTREALHPCQKPLAFAERMIRASSRPGARVLAPFGGTCREAVAIEWMTRRDPAEARQYDACELNQDGPDYIAPVLAQIRGQDHRPGAHRQAPLFGGAA